MKSIDQILKLAEHFLNTVISSSRYEMEQERFESDPDAYNAYLDRAKNYMGDYRAKNPEKIKQIMEKARPKEMAKRKELRSANSIEALSFRLGNQISNLKSYLKTKHNPQHPNALIEFEPIVKQLNDLRFNIKEFEFGFDPINPAYVAKPETLYKLITHAEQIHKQINQKLPKISETLLQLIIKLKEFSDNYSKQ